MRFISAADPVRMLELLLELGRLVFRRPLVSVDVDRTLEDRCGEVMVLPANDASLTADAHTAGLERVRGCMFGFSCDTGGCGDDMDFARFLVGTTSCRPCKIRTGSLVTSGGRARFSRRA